jgi:hypothetical protein
MYSIVIPYLSKNDNFDKCVSYIEKNSLYPFEIVPIRDETDVYYAYNSGVYRAKYDRVVLMNDDMIVSKNWDELLVPFCTEERVLTFNVVEKSPGFIEGKPSCLQMDCGDNFENFDEDKFDKFISYHKQFQPSPTHGKGWYMPIVFHKKSFISYPNINKFPYPNDILLIDHILPNNGYTFIKMPRYVYHFAMRATKERLENESTCYRS